MSNMFKMPPIAKIPKAKLDSDAAIANGDKLNKSAKQMRFKRLMAILSQK